MQNENFFQKVGNILNTSSNTFMLIALVSLFVLPIAMAKNLEPVVQSAYRPGSTAFISEQETDVDESNQSIVDNSENVLGVSTSRNMTQTIRENTESIEFFDNHSSTVTDKNYTLTLATSKRFNKTEVFKILNTGASTLSYEINGIVNGDLKIRNNQDKTLFIADVPYEINGTSVPTKLMVSPGEEIPVYLMSNRTSPTNVTITVTANQE